MKIHSIIALSALMAISSCSSSHKVLTEDNAEVKNKITSDSVHTLNNEQNYIDSVQTDIFTWKYYQPADSSIKAVKEFTITSIRKNSKRSISNHITDSVFTTEKKDETRSNCTKNDNFKTNKVNNYTLMLITIISALLLTMYIFKK